jgi:hypothetical protein
MANDVACKHVARDFARPTAERKFFRQVEPNLLPGTSADGDVKIRKTIASLHESILGRFDAINSAEVERSFRLFAGIVKDAREQKGIDKQEAWACRQSTPAPPADPHYTIRAWRGVVTYLLRRQEFLYE